MLQKGAHPNTPVGDGLSNEQFRSMPRVIWNLEQLGHFCRSCAHNLQSSPCPHHLQCDTRIRTHRHSLTDVHCVRHLAVIDGLVDKPDCRSFGRCDKRTGLKHRVSPPGT